MALPVLVGMAARYAGTKVVEKGLEKSAHKGLIGLELLISSGVLKEGLQAVDKGGRLDVAAGPAKSLLSTVTEPPLPSIKKGASLGIK